MCDFENYEDAVRMYLPQVTKLDGQDVVGRVKLPVYSSNNNFKSENFNPNIKKSPLRQGLKSTAPNTVAFT